MPRSGVLLSVERLGSEGDIDSSVLDATVPRRSQYQQQLDRVIFPDTVGHSADSIPTKMFAALRVILVTDFHRSVEVWRRAGRISATRK
jgi:hypothetical protein